MNEIQNPVPGAPKSDTKKYLIIGAVVLGLIVLYGIQSFFSPERMVERAFESATDGAYDINITEDGASYTIEGEDGARMEFSENASASLPKEWPNTLPVPGDASIEYATSVAGADGSRALSVSYSTSDSLASVAAEYTTVLEGNGWTIDSNSATADWNMITAKQNEDSVMLYITDNVDVVSVTINLQLAAS